MADSSNMAPMLSALNNTGGSSLAPQPQATGVDPAMMAPSNLPGAFNGQAGMLGVPPPPISNDASLTGAMPLMPNEPVTPAVSPTTESSLVGGPTTGIPGGETATMPQPIPPVTAPSPAAGLPPADVMNWLGKGMADQSASFGNSMPSYLNPNMYSALRTPPPADSLMGAAPLS